MREEKTVAEGKDYAVLAMPIGLTALAQSILAFRYWRAYMQIKFQLPFGSCYYPIIL